MCFLFKWKRVHVCATSETYINIILLFTYLCIYVFLVISVQGSEDCVTRFSVNKKQCVTARTNQLMHVDNIIYHKKTQTCKFWLVSLTGTLPRDFRLQFFSCISFRQTPALSIPLGLFLIFSKIRRDILSSKCITGIVDTGDKWKKSSIFFLKFTLRCQQSDTVSSFCHRWQIYRRCR